MPSTDRQNAIHAILEELVASDAISLALVGNEDGFLVAAMPETEAASVAAAVGASLRQLADRVADGPVVDEISIQLKDRQKLVCRPFSCQRIEMLLSVRVQPNRPYRRLTGSAMRRICAVWTAG